MTTDDTDTPRQVPLLVDGVLVAALMDRYALLGIAVNNPPEVAETLKAIYQGRTSPESQP